MAEQTKVLRSEHTKDMSPEELAELQEKVGQMSEEELKAFRNSMNPDDMGHCRDSCPDSDIRCPMEQVGSLPEGMKAWLQPVAMRCSRYTQQTET